MEQSQNLTLFVTHHNQYSVRLEKAFKSLVSKHEKIQKNSLKDSYLEPLFASKIGDSDANYTRQANKRLFNLETIALFSEYIFTISSGKEFESIEYQHLACLFYKLMSSTID